MPKKLWLALWDCFEQWDLFNFPATTMFNSTTYNPCCAPALSRRALLLLAASGSLLSACGGGHDDGETAHSNGKTQLASAHCVSAGLVGVAVGEVLPAQRLLSVAGMRRQGVIEPIQPDDLFCVGSNTARVKLVVASFMQPSAAYLLASNGPRRLSRVRG